MKPLALALALLGAAPPDDAWWNRDWRFRRPVTLRNPGDHALAKGYTMQLEVDPDYLQIRDKSRPELEDWALVRGGERVPFLLQPSGRVLRMCFRTAAEIPANADDRYYLYYGAPGAAAARATADEVFDFWEDFSRPEALADRFRSDKDLTATVHDGALVIREVANDRTASSPARLVFATFPALDGFELSFDLEMDSNELAGASFAVAVDLKEAGSNDAALAKKVDELVEKLGDDSWENREKATKELIALGRAAAARILAASRSSDAEVKWRASHILRMIQENFPAPTISAGASGGQAGVTAWYTSVIGKNRARIKQTGGWPVKVRIVTQRDPDGEVKVLWNGRYPQSGQMPGALREVAFTIHKASGAALGTIKVDNILVRRFVDEESRPTSLIDVEQTRP
jgi:hypothetical protein